MMIGPSSSHMAGVIRIGMVAHRLMGAAPEHATVTFYNSLAHTYKGHGSAKGIIAGLLNFSIDDIRVLKSFEHAKNSGLSFVFKGAQRADVHPNTLLVEMVKEKKMRSVVGESIGGGAVQITSIDGFRCFFTGKENTLVIHAHDVAGNIAKTSNLLFAKQRNIANMTVNRSEKRKNVLYVIEIDDPITSEEIEEIADNPSVESVTHLPPIY